MAEKSAGGAPIKLWIRVMLPGSGQIGPGKAELLRKIRECRSISGAAREMKMSYPRAWLLVEDVNSAFRQPLVAKWLGGRSSGGATLTPTGVKVLELYGAVLERADGATRSLLDDVATMTAGVVRQCGRAGQRRTPKP
jgi:molybdate transport system regulatory protein